MTLIIWHLVLISYTLVNILLHCFYWNSVFAIRILQVIDTQCGLIPFHFPKFYFPIMYIKTSATDGCQNTITFFMPFGPNAQGNFSWSVSNWFLPCGPRFVFSAPCAKKKFMYLCLDRDCLFLDMSATAVLVCNNEICYCRLWSKAGKPRNTMVKVRYCSRDIGGPDINSVVLWLITHLTRCCALPTTNNICHVQVI
jgi:hypothetical protein